MIKWSCVRVFALLCLWAFFPIFTAHAGPPYQSLEVDGQIFSEKILSQLVSMPLEYREAIWPTSEERERAIPLAMVPKDALDHAERWIEDILRPAYVPEHKREHFVALTRDVPLTPPQSVDYLYLRYKLDDADIQIMENGIVLGVLFRPSKARDGLSADEYVFNSLRTLLRLPEMASVKYSRRAASRGNVEMPEDLWHGAIEFTAVGEDAAQRNWWQRIKYWTDGRCVYFCIGEREGEKDTDLHSALGLPRRF
jgi:hypothetical protein